MCILPVDLGLDSQLRGPTDLLCLWATQQSIERVGRIRFRSERSS